MTRGQVVYVGGMKLIPEPKACRRKNIRVLHKRYGESTDRGHNVILLTRRDVNQKHINRIDTEACDISGSFDVRVGRHQAQLGTLSLAKD